MYAITVPLSKWHEVRLYLEHNYYTVNRDYTFIHHSASIELTVHNSDLYERVKARFDIS